MNYMERDELIANLLITANEAIGYTQDFVIEILPEKYRLCRCNPNLKIGWIRKLLIQFWNRQPKNRYLGPFSAEEIIDYYWQDKLHPSWVELEIIEIEDDHCKIIVKSIGRWTDDDDRIKVLAGIKKSGHPPFSCGVSLPPFIEAISEGKQIKPPYKKFSVHWRKSYRVPFKVILLYYIYSNPLYVRYYKWRYK